MGGSIQQSYRLCRQICRRARSNFPAAFRLLSREKAAAMEVIYAFCRFTDDLVDENSHSDPRQWLEDWRTLVADALCGEALPGGLPGNGGPVIRSGPLADGYGLLPALSDVSRRYRIPAEPFLAVIDGVARDIDFRPFATFGELEDYCGKVASAVGTACLYVWGFDGDSVPAEAHDCGVAFQLTNILRDLREDAARGRIYLPLDELARFGCQADEILTGCVSDAWNKLLDFQITRAQGFYQRAAGAFERLHPEGRRIFGLMFSVYWELLREVGRRKANLFRERPAVPWWKKLILTVRWTFGPTQLGLKPETTHSGEEAKSGGMECGCERSLD